MKTCKRCGKEIEPREVPNYPDLWMHVKRADYLVCGSMFTKPAEPSTEGTQAKREIYCINCGARPDMEVACNSELHGHSFIGSRPAPVAQVDAGKCIYCGKIEGAHFKFSNHEFAPKFCDEVRSPHSRVFLAAEPAVAQTEFPPPSEPTVPDRVQRALRRITERLKVIAANGEFDERDIQFIENELWDVWDHH